MAVIKALVHRLLSWCPLYRIALGGYRYYVHSQERISQPTDFLQFGKGAKVCSGTLIVGADKMYVGDGAYVSQECMIFAMGGFHLGNYSGLGARSIVLTVEHRHAGAETLPFGEARIVKPVYIEDYVWVGMDARILPGVRIGEGAIVGLGSVVTKDIPPLAIVMGNPAQIVGHRDKEAFYRLKAEGAVRPVRQHCSLLWVPLLTRRKYRDQLKEFGFDTSDGREFFEYRHGPEP